MVGFLVATIASEKKNHKTSVPSRGRKEGGDRGHAREQPKGEAGGWQLKGKFIGVFPSETRWSSSRVVDVGHLRRSARSGSRRGGLVCYDGGLIMITVSEGKGSRWAFSVVVVVVGCGGRRRRLG